MSRPSWTGSPASCKGSPFQALHRCYNQLTTYVSKHIVKGGQPMKIEVKKVEKILATVTPLPKSDS
jgi:hypothetical protein